MGPLALAATLLTIDTGAADQSSRLISLDEASATFVGEGRGDEAGVCVSGAGDVNGDGFCDFLVGSWSNDEGGPDAGKVYLILGRETVPSGQISLASAEGAFVGENEGDFAGYSLAGVGDVNGDRLDDFVIGAQGSDARGEDSGKAYLILGREEADWGRAFSLANADVFIRGGKEHDFCGFSVAGAGDINGDGLDDFMVGSHRWSPTRSHHRYGWGKVYLFFGRREDWPSLLDVAAADVSLVGEQSGDMAGFSLARAGDVNGDGLSDILVGAWGGSTTESGPGTEAGRVYLLLGRRGEWRQNMGLQTADSSFIAERARQRVGHAVSGVGDVDGDGLDDFVIAAPRDPVGGGDNRWGGAGQVYLIFGHEDPWQRRIPLATAPASYTGQTSSDQAGISVGWAGDVNGDGMSDVLIGSRGDDDTGTRRGQVHVVLGTSVGWAREASLATSDATYLGQRPRDEAGCSVAGIGDFNGDGRDDFVIGASGGGTGRTGVAHLILSPDQWPRAARTFLSLEEQLQYCRAVGDEQGALAALRRTAIQRRSDLDIHRQLVRMARETGDPETLRDAWSTVVSHSEGDGVETLWGEALSALAELGLTVPEALTRGDAETWQCHAVALWLSGRGRFQDGLAAWDRALAVGPEHVEYHFGRHRCLMRLGRHQEALEAAQTAQRFDPRHGFGPLYVGDALRALGHLDQAREQWKRCLECKVDGGSHELARWQLAHTENL